MPPYGRGHNKLAITKDCNPNWNPVTLNPITGGGADVLDGSFLGACVRGGRPVVSATLAADVGEREIHCRAVAFRLNKARRQNSDLMPNRRFLLLD